jgi:hypothetical protein
MYVPLTDNLCTGACGQSLECAGWTLECVGWTALWIPADAGVLLRLLAFGRESGVEPPHSTFATLECAGWTALWISAGVGVLLHVLAFGRESGVEPPHSKFVAGVREVMGRW